MFRLCRPNNISVFPAVHRGAAFTPLQLTHASPHRNFPTPTPIRMLKRAKARAPQPERAIHGASPFGPQAHLIFRESSEFHALKRHKCRAPIGSRAATAGVRIRHDFGRCTMASRARLSPETLSRDSVPCIEWRASNAPRPG